MSSARDNPPRPLTAEYIARAGGLAAHVTDELRAADWVVQVDWIRAALAQGWQTYQVAAAFGWPNNLAVERAQQPQAWEQGWAAVERAGGLEEPPKRKKKPRRPGVA